MAKKIKQPKVVITTEEPKTLWQKIKDWFYNSETIFMAWITAITGAITTTITGILGSTDFSSIFSMLQSGLSFTKQQLMVMGIGAIGLGVLQYWARVRGTKAVEANLLPKT